MAFVTALTEGLGIEIPVIQAGMQWVGYAELSSAVSNAGGLGILTGLTQPTPEDLRKEIRKCRSMTNKPFGVNLTLLPAINPPDYAAYARVIIEEGVKIVETAGYSPGAIIKFLKTANIKILHKCTTVRHALSAEKLGVDFISMDGFEAAGHIGDTDIPNMVLLRRAAQSLHIPFIASGGFADGQGLAAALGLGACGINMGTRFMSTVESPIHINVKRAIVEGKEEDTELLLRKWKNTSRLYKNGVAIEAKKIESEQAGSEFKDVQHLVAGARGKRVFIDGDVNAGVWTVGPVLGVVQDIPTCEVLLKRIEQEALETIAKLNQLSKVGSKL
ncbi:inosine monophosphate dehydrogenase [Lophium mytilinum]|uniref:Inosine monophosphate dehydrogenase n=1 Tax=Lophium mytilinum TaxID=390894 RepID=A0A6A6RBS2_9PEZI|nr:inosine monophosphate dehydrogenase [Lophium mytilinum]